ncbi:MAG TPA: ABC transporter permease [Clostridiaceae bacterium]|nr:ABC transporter permease [Clostridiaceae bacterium]
MNRFFYQKLAVNNIKKNAKAYMPYILACIGTIIMFYNINFLAEAKDIENLNGSNSLRTILFLGTGVIGVFSLIFLFYTNSFLIKQRKKEFGLFNILGMEKKHIARIMFYETIFIAFLCIFIGILAGILLSKLMILLLFKIISFRVVFGFEIPAGAVLLTMVLFAGIFMLNLIYNIFQVHLSKPIELLKGGNAGEKEPKIKWVLTVIGALSLGIGYYIALATESPLEAINIFFVAVLFVITGTYCLFIAGSIALLKILRKNKNYYYNIKHFISVSGMIYRMKRNAAGLASICILSTAVIVMISTTVSLYTGIEDVLRTRYPRNIIVTITDISEQQVEKLDTIIEEQVTLINAVKKDVIRYRYKNFLTIQNGTDFTTAKEEYYPGSNVASVTFITLQDYNKMENQSVSLSEGEAFLYTLRGNIPGDDLDFNGYKISVKERLPSLNVEGRMSAVLYNNYYLVVSDISTIKEIYNRLHGNDDIMEELSYYYAFDMESSGDSQINLVKELQKAINNLGLKGYVEGPEIARESFYSLYGGLFFLGIFLGLLFIMATVLIIYYKQVVEGHEDKERFEIMQKVGLSREEIKKSIHSQVLTVFFLPLVTAVIHIAFAFKVITKLLVILNLTNIPLFALCTALTILVFALFYAMVYALTAKTYYKIVS